METSGNERAERSSRMRERFWNMEALEEYRRPCNRKRDSIKVLRYDQNGFILATKKLLDDMKFQWLRTPDEVKEISFQQVEWLLQGLEIEQKKAHHQVKIDHENSCF